MAGRSREVVGEMRCTVYPVIKKRLSDFVV